MHRNNQLKCLGLAAGLVLMAALPACQGNGSTSTDESVASADFAIVLPPPPDGTTPDFRSNWVRIKGDRSTNSDGKYPCLDHIDKCIHFDTSDGYIDSTRVPELRYLCPSKNTPYGEWTFSFEIYDSPSRTSYECENRIRDNLLKNLECPKIGPERLDPGCQVNEVLCWTENATKEFDFDICVANSRDINECFTPCCNDYQCAEGWYCDLPNPPVGTTTTTCDPMVTSGGGWGRCAPGCETNYDCLDGWRCELDPDSSPAKICKLQCWHDIDCGDNHRCDMCYGDSGVCVGI